MRCAGKARNPFQTTQGKRLSCRDQVGPLSLIIPPRKASCWENPCTEEAVHSCSPWGRTELDTTEVTWQQHEGALPPPCIVHKDPRVPHTAWVSGLVSRGSKGLRCPPESRSAVACQAPLSMGILQARILEWVAVLPLGNLANPGPEPTSLTSPALAGRFFTTSATWEAL